MKALLEQGQREYDLVVIDTPPLSLVPDAFPLLGWADGTLIVSRLGQSRRDVAARMRDTLASAEAPVIGVVANGYETPDRSDYTYHYAPPSTPHTDTPPPSTPHTDTPSVLQGSQNGGASVPARRDEPVPVAAEPVPMAAEPVPIAAEPVPIAAEPVPIAAEPVPIAAEPVPIAAEPVPIAAEPVPIAAEPVPIAAEPGPVAHEPVSGTRARPEWHTSPSRWQWPRSRRRGMEKLAKLRSQTCRSRH